MGVLDDLRGIDDQSRLDEIETRRRAAAPNYTDALKSGALDMLSGFQAVFGKSGFEKGQKTADESAALAPQTPELYGTLTNQGALATAKALGPVAAASAPQLGLTLAAGAAGLAAGPFAPIVSPALMIAANIPYWYGKNLIGQADRGYSDKGRQLGIKKDYEDLNKTRAITAAGVQSAADALVSVLFPAAKIIPGMGRGMLSRMSKGFLAGVVEETTAETAQEALSIFNEQPELKALLTPESLKRLQIAAEYGGAIGGPLGATIAARSETPSLHRDPADVAGQMAAQEHFTPAAVTPGEGETVLWMRPEQLVDLSGFKGKAPKKGIFAAAPTLEVRDDGAGGKAVFNASGMEAAAAMAQRGVGMVPVRIKGLGDSKFLQWDGKQVDLELKPYTGKGTAKSPSIVTSEADLAPARARAARGKGPGYIQAWGMDIAIQTPKGGLRKGDNGGVQWSSVAPADYGEAKRGADADGEPLDMWIGPDLSAATGFVIEQINPESAVFQEHKAMLGFKSAEDALHVYDASFSDGSGPTRRRSITPLPMSKIKAWTESGNTSKPISEALKDGALPVTPDDVRDVAKSIGIDWAADPSFMQAVRIVTGGKEGSANLANLREPALRRLHEMLSNMRDAGVDGKSFTNPLMMSWEATPSTSLTEGHLNPTSESGRRTENREYTEAVAYHNMIERSIRDKDGRDRLARSLGIEELSNIVGPGWWKGQSNPSTQQQLALTTAGYTTPTKLRLGDTDVDVQRLTPMSRSLLNAYAAGRGLLSKQDAVGWHYATPVEAPNTANGLDVDLGEPISPKQLAKLMSGFDDENVVPIPTPFGVRLFRVFKENGNTNNFNPKWAEAAQKVVEKSLKKNVAAIGYSFVEGGKIENDWKNENQIGGQSGEGYQRAFDAVASPDARRELGDILTNLEDVEREEAKRRGLGFSESFAKSIYSDRRFRERAPFKDRASVPLGGLDPSPESQEAVYGLFGYIKQSLADRTDSKFYDLKKLIERPWNIDRLLDRYRYRVKYHSFEENPETGVQWRTPDLKRDGYKNGTLWIYNPKNEKGSFFDPDYTNAWRITHELGHAITEEFMQRKYGDSRREGRLGRSSVGYRGAPGKTVEIELPPLTLKEAQRAIEWEDNAFRTQRMLLEEAGVDIDSYDFAREYNTNLADAMYRVISGDFGDPSKRGFDPSNTPADLKSALQMLEDAELKLAAEQGRPPTSGVDLSKWRQVRDDELMTRMERARSRKGGGKAKESERLGLKSDSRFDSPEEMLPGFYSPIQKAIIDSDTDEATGKEWREILHPSERKAQTVVKGGERLEPVIDPKTKQQKVNPKTGEPVFKKVGGQTEVIPARAAGPAEGLKPEELEWTGILDWLDMFGDEKLTKSEVVAYLKDRTPVVHETYYGAPPKPVTNLPALIEEAPPPAVVEEEQEEEEEEPPDLPSFDEDTYETAEPDDSDRERYADDRIEDQLQSRWDDRKYNDDADLLEELATKVARHQKEEMADLLDEAYSDNEGDDRTWDFEVISDADERGLMGVASDLGLADYFAAIQKQLELPGMERDDDARLEFLKTKLNERANDLFREIHDSIEKNPNPHSRKVNTFTGKLLSKYSDILARERAKYILSEDEDQLEDAYKDYYRDSEYEYLRNDDFNENWAENYAPRIWKYEMDDGTLYEIREQTREGGSFDVFRDGEDIGGRYRSFNAAVDAAQGHAMEDHDEDRSSRPVAAPTAPVLLPPQSTYGGPAKWGSRSLNGGRNYGEIVISVANLPGNYSHSHFGAVQGNTMHIRKSDFNIPNLPGETLLLNEVQSDLFSAGQKQGFYRDAKERDKVKDANQDEYRRYSTKANDLDGKINRAEVEAFRHAIVKSPELALTMRRVFANSDFGTKKQLNKAIDDAGTLSISGGADIRLAFRDALEVDEILRTKTDENGEMGAAAHLDINSLADHIGRRVLERVFVSLTGRAGPREADRLMDGEREKIGHDILNNKTFMREARRLRDLKRKQNEAFDKASAVLDKSGNPLPMHPWGKAWFEFGIKRMLKWAAERDYNYIAIPTAPLMSKIEQWGINATDVNAAMAMSKDRADELLNGERSTQSNVRGSEYEIARTRKMIYAIGKRANDEAPRILKELGKAFGVQPVLVDQATGHPVEPFKAKVRRAGSMNIVLEDGSRVSETDSEMTKLLDHIDAETGEESSSKEVEFVKVGGYQSDTGAPTEKITLKKNYGNGIWVLPITPDMKEGYKKKLPGYARGGLVRRGDS